MDLASIRTKLAARLGVVGGLTVYRIAPALPSLPCAIVRPGPIDVHSTFDEGVGDVHFGVQLLVDLTDWNAAQTALDTYCSDGSVVDALEADPHSDGLSVLVSMIEPQGMVQYGALQCATVTFRGDVFS